MKIHDLSGREVATLVNEIQSPGTYKVYFNARNQKDNSSLASGVYFYTLSAGNKSLSKKLLLMK
jgi:hypothetical protein